MEKVTDEYCDKIFSVLIMNNEKIRFNKLHRKLTKYGAKMSRPTLIEHLNHLIKNEIIQRNEEGKQEVYYEPNWKRFQQVATKEFNRVGLLRARNEKAFKSKSVDQQVIYTTAIETIGELFYLRLSILDAVDPKNKLQNYYGYTMIRRLLNIYCTWLVDTCKESKENSENAIKSIDRSIKTLTETFFEINPENTDVPSKNEPQHVPLEKTTKTINEKQKNQ
jgi:predicted transcriptional regulator